MYSDHEKAAWRVRNIERFLGLVDWVLWVWDAVRAARVRARDRQFSVESTDEVNWRVKSRGCDTRSGGRLVSQVVSAARD